MAAFLKALLFVVVGEMGDKTQLLAMAMASKYKISQVMIGVFLATILNHALAVLMGSYLSSVISMNLVSIAAGISFLVFGIWTIRGDSNDEKNKNLSRFGPILTVGMAFFLAEMGDKTQLMTITIAAEFQQPVVVLMGTTTGMMIADGIGVFFGTWVCKHVPEIYIKWTAGIVFIFFGSLTLLQAVPPWLINPFYITLYVMVMMALIYLIGVRLAVRQQSAPCDHIIEETTQGEESPIPYSVSNR